MANPTSNFGWQMPTNTDLVKDLPADFEVFGQAVDTSLMDLKGGTTGQILSKASNSDMDFTWIANDQGDITAVTAGTGISGGGTSGAVTITNSMATAIDAKGDLVAGTGADAFARLAVGNNGETLIADSTASTGLKWAKSANFVGCSVTNSTAQTISNNTDTDITFDTETYDTNDFHSLVTNTGRLTIPSGLAGYYLVISNQRFASNSTGRRIMSIMKNGAAAATVEVAPSASGSTSLTVSAILNLAVADYVGARIFQTSGGDLTNTAIATSNYLQIRYLGA